MRNKRFLDERKEAIGVQIAIEDIVGRKEKDFVRVGKN